MDRSAVRIGGTAGVNAKNQPAANVGGHIRFGQIQFAAEVAVDTGPDRRKRNWPAEQVGISDGLDFVVSGAFPFIIHLTQGEHLVHINRVALQEIT